MLTSICTGNTSFQEQQSGFYSFSQRINTFARLCIANNITDKTKMSAENDTPNVAEEVKVEDTGSEVC